MSERLRAVVVGPGFIGMVHADALRRNGVEVAAFVGSGADTGRQRAEEFGTAYYPSLAEALAGERCDAVHIATPNHLHAPLALEAIAAGKHVICEKPLAMDVAEGETLLRRAAAQPGASLQVRQNLALVLGLQGKIAEAEAIIRRDLPPDQADRNLDWLRRQTGGGVHGAPRTWDSLQGG